MLAALLIFCCGRNDLPMPETPAGPDTLHHHEPGTFRFYNQPDVVARICYVIVWSNVATETTGPLRLGDTVTLVHTWLDTGHFTVRCRVIAVAADRPASAWSEPKQVTVINAPPLPPTAVLGRDTLPADSAAEFRAATTDPEADIISYCFDWGDGRTTTASGYASGDTARLLYSWSAPGEYWVRVRAQDTLGAASGWSPVLVVTVVP